MKKFLPACLLLLFISTLGRAQTSVEAFSASVIAGLRGPARSIQDGIGEEARFLDITAMWGDGTNLYVADSTTLRQIDLNNSRVTTVSRVASSGQRNTLSNSGFNYDYGGLYGLWSDGAFVYGTDIGQGTIRMINLRGGGVQTIASGLGLPWGLAVVGSNFYVASAQKGEVLEVDLSGNATTFVSTGSGTPYQCFLGSGCIGYFPAGPQAVWSDGEYLYLSGYSGTVKRVRLNATLQQDFLPEVPFDIGPLTGAPGQIFVAARRGLELGVIETATGRFTPITLPPDNSSIKALWSDGMTLYVAQGSSDTQVIRRVDLATGDVTILAGTARAFDFADGSGTSARFHSPAGIWGDSNSLYVADQLNRTIRRIDVTDGSVSTLAGSVDRAGFQDGVGTSASFVVPGALWGDSSTLFVGDSYGVRSINLNTAQVKTVFGSPPSGKDLFRAPPGLWVRDGILYFAGPASVQQWNLATNEVSTFAGQPGEGAGPIDGPLLTARFQGTGAMWSDGRTLYVLDVNRIRAISFDDRMVRTVASLPATGSGLWGNGDSLYTLVPVGTTGFFCLYRIAISTGEVSQVVHGNDASEGLPMLSPGDGGIWGSNGDLFITDSEENTVRRLTRVKTPSLVRVDIDNPGFSSKITNGAPPSATSITQARISSNPAGMAPAGLAIYALRRNGVLVSETSVFPTRPIRSGRISAAAAGRANTALAIGNPNSATATIEFYFTDSAGNDFGRGSFNLAGRAQIARFITDAPFNGLAPIDGTLTLMSSEPVNVIALHGYFNERSEFLMATLPVAEFSPLRLSVSPATVPHFVVGGGWTTELTLVNVTDQRISGTLQFPGIDSSGPFASGYNIEPRSSQHFQLTIASANQMSGAIRVIPGVGYAPTAVGILAFTKDGVRIAETSVSDVPSASAFRSYVEFSGNFSGGQIGWIQSGLAITNTSPNAVDVVVEIADGQQYRMNRSAVLHIEGLQHVFKLVDEILPPLQRPRNYLFRISAPTPDISVVGFRNRYNERGELLMTTTPAIPENTSFDQSPLYIPHIVNGGGFSTEFILFSSTPQSMGTSLSVTTEFSDQVGASTAVPMQ